MNIILTQAQARKEIDRLTAENKQLAEENAEHVAEIESLETARADAESSATVARSEVAEKDEALEALVKERDEALAGKAAAEAAQVEFDEKVESAALAKFQELGGEAAPAAGSHEQSSEEIVAQFSKMKPGAERTAFFKAHKDILSVL